MTGIRSALHRRNRLFTVIRRIPRAVTALLVVLVVGSAVVLLWDARNAALSDARTTAANLAALLTEQSTIAFRTTDLALRAIEQRLESEDLPQDDPNFRAYLLMMEENLDYVRAIFIIGEDGFITHDTDYPNTPRVSLVDRSYFLALQGESNEKIFIGEPLLSRSVARWFVPVARRLENTEGKFSGIAVAAVEPLFFERTYRRLKLREHDSIGHLEEPGVLSGPGP